MKLSALPPVRRAVPLTRGDSGARAAMERFFGNRSITLYASGTAALAEAIANCAARSSVSTPEVIIPAYGCPDLVSACIHASVYPRLVDVASSRWSYDLDALKSALSPNTVAIVAVNLLGLGDGSAELSRLCKDRHIPLIQDSAQYLPREPIDWPGDYIVLSFGRGKPMNLLHGGALIEPAGDSRTISGCPTNYTGRNRFLASRAAAIIFNFLTCPSVYRLISELPGTRLGEVAYEPLAQAALLPERAWNQVGIAFHLYRQGPAYRRDIWESAIAEWSALGITALRSPGRPLPPEPLRLALLAPSAAARDSLVETLNLRGLGASRFYATDLPTVKGTPDVVKCQGPFPHASALAATLFTLPTHTLVTAGTVRSARTSVLEWHRSHAASPEGGRP